VRMCQIGERIRLEVDSDSSSVLLVLIIVWLNNRGIPIYLNALLILVVIKTIIVHPEVPQSSGMIYVQANLSYPVPHSIGTEGRLAGNIEGPYESCFVASLGFQNLMSFHKPLCEVAQCPFEDADQRYECDASMVGREQVTHLSAQICAIVESPPLIGDLKSLGRQTSDRIISRRRLLARKNVMEVADNSLHSVVCDLEVLLYLLVPRHTVLLYLVV